MLFVAHIVVLIVFSVRPSEQININREQNLKHKLIADCCGLTTGTKTVMALSLFINQIKIKGPESLRSKIKCIVKTN